MSLRASLFLVASVIGVLTLAPRLGNVLAGADGIHDAAALPEHLELCGRSWHKDTTDRRFTFAGIREWSGVEPVVVDPSTFAPCPPGPCTSVAGPTPCDTVIFVRVGPDAYLDYALQGGP